MFSVLFFLEFAYSGYIDFASCRYDNDEETLQDDAGF